MALADYAHHNEDAMFIWWEEEGKHAEEDAINAQESWRDEDPDPYDYECGNPPTECMEAGNYDHSHDDVWTCSSCGQPFRQVSVDPYVMEPI